MEKVNNSRNKTGFKGVHLLTAEQVGGKRDRYVAQIYLNGKKKGLGYFDTPEEAHEAYLKAKRDAGLLGE